MQTCIIFNIQVKNQDLHFIKKIFYINFQIIIKKVKKFVVKKNKLSEIIFII